MTDWAGKNLLCYGDNLGFLTDTELFPNECIDLIYLDPPFNSQQSYNVLFKEASGTPEAAQIKAFEDTWRWDTAANAALTQIHQDPACPATLVDLMKTFMNFLRPSPMMAYLVQMAIRLVHMHRILKPTGSLYLHCDPTASHYLKLVLDSIFGARGFRNEIIWQRTSAHSDAQRWSRVTDVILYVNKSESCTWHPQYEAHREEYLASKYRYKESDGRVYRLDNMTSPHPRPNMMYEWKGFPCPPFGWRYSKETMERLDLEGRIWYPEDKSKRPQLKRYLHEMSGRLLTNLWTDIPPINSQAQERMGYPTQKPVELLKRIISSSSNPGDVVLDPFCGCGTTIDAVETLNREAVGTTGVSPVGVGGTAVSAVGFGGTPVSGVGFGGTPGMSTGGTPVPPSPPSPPSPPPPRRWIGIDVTHLSIGLIKHRLTRFSPPPEYEVIGEPASVSAAEVLAKEDPFQFQFWALGLIGARPAGQKRKKGADLGIDGVRYILDEQKNGAWVSKRMLVQVKGGGVGSKDIRDFVGTLSREKAEIGVFITLQSPTQPMRSEAASAGMYTSPWDKKAYPKVQILTVEDLLKDPHRPNPRCLLVPGGTEQHTLPEPPRHKTARSRQRSLGFQKE